MNWVLFVLLQIRSSEEGLLYTQGLASTYGDVCCWWVGPWHAVVRVFHPTCIKPVLFAPGTHAPGRSLRVAEVSVLPPAGGVDPGADTRGCLCLIWTPQLPPLRSRLLLPRVCLCDIFCMAMAGHIYVSTCVLVTAGICYTWDQIAMASVMSGVELWPRVFETC